MHAVLVDAGYDPVDGVTATKHQFSSFVRIGGSGAFLKGLTIG